MNLSELHTVARNKNQSTSVRNMAAAIIVIQEWFKRKKDKTKEESDFQQFISEYFRYLSNNVLALYLATPDNLDDAYNLFTVLNSRGVQLQVSDILRAQNLRSIEQEAIRKRYAIRWEKFGSSIDEPHETFDDFLWALVFIKMKYRSDDNKSLTGAFDFMYKRNYIQKGEITFEFIGKYIDHFEAVTKKDLGDNAQEKIMFLNLNHILIQTFGSMYVAPLMHYRECFGEYCILEFLIKLDNLCSAYWLLAGRRNLQSRIFIILRKMDEMREAAQSTADGARSFLNSEVLRYDYDDPAAATRIEINDLFDLFDKEPWGSYAGTRINKTRYLLLKLDMLAGSLDSRISFNRNTSSLEHIMPQKPEKPDWTIVSGSPEHTEWVHRLGNIVLLDLKKNSTIQNTSFNSKKKKYTRSIESRANTNYVFMNYSEWGLEAIQHNHHRVLSLLRAYYSHNDRLNTPAWEQFKEDAVQYKPSTGRSVEQLRLEI